MNQPEFQRARSPEAKRLREDAILEAARALGVERSIRDVTLTDIAARAGMHKSALLRYFETREEIFLRLTAAGWQEWSLALAARIRAIAEPGPAPVAEAFAATLARRGMFCDLLAQAPLNLERNVSVGVVRDFKLASLAARQDIFAALDEKLPSLDRDDGLDLIATAVAVSRRVLADRHTGPGDRRALPERPPPRTRRHRRRAPPRPHSHRNDQGDDALTGATRH